MGNDTKCYVGIDPAFRKSGFAICIIDEDNTANFIRFIGILEFVEWLFDAPENAVYCVENSNLQNENFDMRGTRGLVARKGRDVGKNQAVSQLTVDILQKKFGKESVLNLSPFQKGKKIENNTVFMAIVKQEGITLLNYKGLKGEQDERDSFMLAIRAKKWKRNG